METLFYKEALFGGATSNAFKLGTALTAGWFWSRLKGCSILYRGPSIETVDFENMLTVGDADIEQLAAGSHLPHQSNMTYFYVLQRANGAGELEQTLSASVKVAFDAHGDLVALGPNPIFVVKARQVADSRAEIIWFYNPLEQQAEPVCFNVYTDDATGTIDCQNPLEQIEYRGRIHYRYLSDALLPGQYLFAIKTEDADGIEDTSLAWVSIQIVIDTLNPAPYTLSPDVL